jgi:hypothetical protein
MTRAATVRRVLVIEACDLDSDARSRQELEVDAPTDESGQRVQLSNIIARMHPDARMRSFGNEAASFLDREHLVVAHYAGLLGEEPVSRTASAAGEVQQQPLFAA